MHNAFKPKARWTPGQVGRELVRALSDHAVADTAAQLSFYFVFSLFPFLFTLVLVAAYLPLSGALSELVTRLYEVMPSTAAQLVQGHLEDLLQQPRPRLLTLGLLGTLWSASRGVDAYRKALNLAHEVKESRSFVATQVRALLMTAAGSLLLLVSLSFIILGGKAGTWLAQKAHLAQQFAVLWSWLRWPITAALITFLAALLYYLLPDVKQRFRYLTPGSVTGTLLWLLATWGFTQYAENFGDLNATYGSIGGVMVLMLWLYISGFIFIAGGELNAVLEHGARYGKLRGARDEGQLPPPRQLRPSFSPPGAVASARSAERSDRLAQGRPPAPRRRPRIGWAGSAAVLLLVVWWKAGRA